MKDRVLSQNYLADDLAVMTFKIQSHDGTAFYVDANDEQDVWDRFADHALSQGWHGMFADGSEEEEWLHDYTITCGNESKNLIVTDHLVISSAERPDCLFQEDALSEELPPNLIKKKKSGVTLIEMPNLSKVKSAMTQRGYENLAWAITHIEAELKDTRITPDEAYDGLMALGFRETKARGLVNEWGADKFEPLDSSIEVSSGLPSIEDPNWAKELVKIKLDILKRFYNRLREKGIKAKNDILNALKEAFKPWMTDDVANEAYYQLAYAASSKDLFSKVAHQIQAEDAAEVQAFVEDMIDHSYDMGAIVRNTADKFQITRAAATLIVRGIKEVYSSINITSTRTSKDVLVDARYKWSVADTKRKELDKAIEDLVLADEPPDSEKFKPLLDEVDKVLDELQEAKLLYKEAAELAKRENVKSSVRIQSSKPGSGKVLMVFRDKNIENLYKKEISGQISDGAWESHNTDPAFWDADTIIGPSNVALILEGPVHPSFLKNEDETLMDAVGDRIKEYYGTDDEAECIKAIHRIMGMVRFPRYPKEGELEALGYKGAVPQSTQSKNSTCKVYSNRLVDEVIVFMEDLKDQGLKKSEILKKAVEKFSGSGLDEETAEDFYRSLIESSKQLVQRKIVSAEFEGKILRDVDLEGIQHFKRGDKVILAKGENGLFARYPDNTNWYPVEGHQVEITSKLAVQVGTQKGTIEGPDPKDAGKYLVKLDDGTQVSVSLEEEK